MRLTRLTKPLRAVPLVRNTRGYKSTRQEFSSALNRVELDVSYAPNGIEANGIDHFNKLSEVPVAPERPQNDSKHTLIKPIVPAAPNDPFADLINEQRPGFTLTRPMYADQRIHIEDMNRVFKSSWLFAAHSCELANPGDYQIYEVSREISVIVARGKDGKVHAFHNTCRHRGSKLCSAAKDRAPGVLPHQKGNALICPYHRWKYNLTTGECMSAPGLDDSLNKSDFGLLSVGVGEVSGMVFIHLGGQEEEGSFREFADHTALYMDMQKLKDAKMAQVEDFVVESNWKILMENNRECDHCVHGHPEYNQTNYDVEYAYAMSFAEGGQFAQFEGDNLPEKFVAGPKNSKRRQKLLEEITRQEKRTSELWTAWGVPTIPSLPSFPGSGWYRLTRTFLREGFVSQTADGKPGCTVPLAEPPNKPDGWGKTDWDLGVLRINTFPNYWGYCMADHAAMTRMTPIDAHRTHIRQYWMVHRNAEEGKDYDLERMKYVWQATLLQDNELCRVNHDGVISENYLPGPYSPAKEAAVDYFTHGWYMPKFRREK